MFLKEKTITTNSNVVAQTIIGKIHNMPWLKHRPPSNSDNGKEEKVSPDNATTMKKDKRPKAKKSKGPKVEKDVPTLVEQFSMANEEAALPANVWVTEKNITETLFGQAEAAVAEPLSDDEETKRAIQTVLAQSLEEFIQQSTISKPPAEPDVEELGEKSDDDDYWTNKVHNNLPTSEPAAIKKIPDTNNNATVEKSTISLKATGTPERQSRCITARKNDDKTNNYESENKTVDGSVEPPIKPQYIDKYGRPDGYNDRHLHMGHGGRMKEKQYLEQQERLTSNSDNNTMRPNQDLNRHDLSRSMYKSDSREATLINNQRKFSTNVGNQRINDKFHYIAKNRQTRDSADRSTSNVTDRGIIEKEKIPEFPRTPKDSAFLKNEAAARRHNIERPQIQDNSSIHVRKEVVRENRSNYSEKPVSMIPHKSEISMQKSRVDVKTVPGNDSENRELKIPHSSNFSKIQDTRNVVETDIREIIPEEQDSKSLHLSDFKSRYNSPAIEGKRESPKSEVTTRLKPNFKISNNFAESSGNYSPNVDISRCSTDYTVPPPGYQCSQHSQNLASLPNCQLSRDALYANLAVYDPSLYRLLQQNDAREQQRTLMNSTTRDRCSLYENFLSGARSTNFPASEEHLLSYQREISNNYGHVINSRPRTIDPFVVGVDPNCHIVGNREDATRGNVPHIPVGFLPGSDAYGNLIFYNPQSFPMNQRNCSYPVPGSMNMQNISGFHDFSGTYENPVAPEASRLQRQLPVRTMENLRIQSTGNYGNQVTVDEGHYQGSTGVEEFVDDKRYAGSSRNFVNQRNYVETNGKERISRNGGIGNFSANGTNVNRPSRIPQHQPFSSRGRGRGKLEQNH